MPAAPTPAQSAASRANGARSTGPATPAGKAASATNATRHGLRGEGFALLADEDVAQFHALLAELRAQLRPRSAEEERLVGVMVMALWRMARADRLEATCVGTVLDPAAPDAERQRAERFLATILRYRARFWRELNEARTALERRPPPPRAAAPAPAAAHLPSRTFEPEPPAAPPAAAPQRPAPSPLEPGPARPLNRAERRRRAALARQQARRAA
jgi:hypothetical protein